MTKTGMVFGVFDSLHEGHRHFLSQAKGLCETLIVVVTRDEVCKIRKGFVPRHTEHNRIETIRSFDSALLVVLGDERDDEWHIIDEHDPDRVYLGYDQGAIGEELRKMGIPFTYLDAYRPGEFKSSLIR